MKLDLKLNNIQLYGIIIFSFFINLILKLYHIDLAALSYDESISLKDTYLDFGHIKHEAEWDANPPFYYYCLWIWTKLFGTTEIGLRSFSAFCSSLTLLFTSIFLAKRFSHLSALIFIILFSVHPALFYYAQEARSYSLVLLLVSLSFITFYHFIQKPNIIYTLLLGFLNFLLFYTHYITFFLIAFQFFVLVFFERKKTIPLILANLLALLLILIRFTKKQYNVIFGISTDSVDDKWIANAGMKDLLGFIEQMYFNPIVYIVILLLIMIAIPKNLKVKNTRPFLVFLAVSAIFTPILFFIFGTYIPVFVNRYVLYAVFISLVLLAIFSQWDLKLLIPIFLMIIFSIINFNWCYTKGYDFRKVGAFVKEHKKNSMVILNTKDITGLFTYYYDKSIYDVLIKGNGIERLKQNNIFEANGLEDLKDLNYTSQNTIILVQLFDTEIKNQQIYNFFESKGYNMEKYPIFTNVKFILFKK